MGISHDCMDCSGLLSKFFTLILDYCKLLSENIHISVVGFSLVGNLGFFALSSIHGNFIKGYHFCCISVPNGSIFQYFIFIEIV